MSDWGICSAAQIRAQAKYDADHTKRISLKLNLRTDFDIIKWCSMQRSLQGSIKRLIREEIARKKTEKPSSKPEL